MHIINDYGDCYKKEAKYDINKDKEYIENSQNHDNNGMAAQIFDFKKYSKSENLKEFRERFAQSQAFIHFIEEAYQLNKGYADNPAIAFFNK